MSGEETVSVSFTNTRDNDRSGGGITNHFTYDGGNWNWTQTSDNMQTVNGNRDTGLTQDSGSDGTGANDTNG